MKERPILFTGAMVRALLDGRKTQTRRIVKPQPKVEERFVGRVLDSTIRSEIGKCKWATGEFPAFTGGTYARCPYGVPGDRLWVKEAWYTAPFFNHLKPSRLREDTPIHYAVDDGKDVFRGGPLRSPLFMQRHHSRITLEITSVRVERLNNISYEDARAEGIEQVGEVKPDHVVFWKNYQYQDANPRKGVTIEDRFHRIKGYSDPIASYQSLWDKINGDGSWALNPWVWVIEFRRVEN